MPIYAYKCASCGFAKDVLQKISDAPLADCPQCGAASFTKQVTAAGFQLKGSGWYVTDFRGGASKPAEAAAGGGTEAAKGETAKSDTAKNDTAKGDTAKPDAPKTEPAKTESKPSESTPPKSGAPSASGGCGASSAGR
jgi:putative FmdB family regulatory protein